MRKTGGCAFPRTQWTGSDKNTAHRDVEGMTLRDYFAGQALAGLASACNQEGNWTGNVFPNVANEAYMIADAMIAERNKEQL